MHFHKCLIENSRWSPPACSTVELLRTDPDPWLRKRHMVQISVWCLLWGMSEILLESQQGSPFQSLASREGSPNLNPGCRSKDWNPSYKGEQKEKARSWSKEKVGPTEEKPEDQKTPKEGQGRERGWTDARSSSANERCRAYGFGPVKPTERGALRF